MQQTLCIARKNMLAALLGATLASASFAVLAADKKVDSVRMTWYGITNWHYQIGSVGVILDGESVNGALSATSVAKQLSAIRLNGTVDVIIVGHEHGDHSNQIPELAKQTNAHVYAPARVCTRVVAAGVNPARCTTLDGGETITLSDAAAIRVVRWVHSVDCGETTNGTGGPETFGFLFTVNTMPPGAQAAFQRAGNNANPGGNKVLNWYVSDSGAGGPDLTTPRVANGRTYGSPMQNLAAAVQAAGIEFIDIWQGGPESRMVYQARQVVPTFNVKTFMPHHLNARANAQSRFKLEYGMHYPYSLDDQPKLRDFLAGLGVPQVFPANYWDAWVYDRDGIRTAANTDMKALYGIPPAGPGPGVQGPNPRAGELECPTD